MTYNVFSKTAPAMQNLNKGTEFAKQPLSQASKNMRKESISMAILALATYFKDAGFMRFDNKYHEMCSLTSHFSLVGGKKFPSWRKKALCA